MDPPNSDEPCDEDDVRSRQVQVVLHVVEGRLHELELFVDEGATVSLPAPSDLRDVRVEP